MLIALALVQAVLALTTGECFAKGRTALGLLAILVLIACEACSFIATANLQLASIETHAGPVHDAAIKHQAAAERLARAEQFDAVERAEKAKARVDADVMAKSTEKSCATNCRQILEAQVAAATAAVEAARLAALREVAEARGRLSAYAAAGLRDAARGPPRRERPRPWICFYVGIRGFAVSVGAALLLVFGAPRPTPAG